MKSSNWEDKWDGDSTNIWTFQGPESTKYITYFCNTLLNMLENNSGNSGGEENSNEKIYLFIWRIYGSIPLVMKKELLLYFLKYFLLYTINVLSIFDNK